MKLLILSLLLLAFTGCLEPGVSTCTTTLWAERTPDVIVCTGGTCITREVYAAKITVRSVEGTPCEAEEYLAERERPLAWTHDCGCNPEEEMNDAE